ncbi:hypothetical protein IW261DRAFT_165519, partial [Armillaria novae-zelandiae]
VLCCKFERKPFRQGKRCATKPNISCRLRIGYFDGQCQLASLCHVSWLVSQNLARNFCHLSFISPTMYEEDLLSALTPSGYGQHLAEAMPPDNHLPWTTNPELFQYFENVSPLSLTSSSSNSDDAWQSQAGHPQHGQPVCVVFTLPNASRFRELDISSTGGFFDGMHSTSQSSIPPNFEPADVASAIPDLPRKYTSEPSQPFQLELTCSPAREIDSTLSSMSFSSSRYSERSHSSSPPIFEPTNVVFTPRDASRTFDALGLWSTDAYFNGIYPGTDATNNSFRDLTVKDFGFLNQVEMETGTIQDVRDNHVDSGIGEHNGMAFSTISASILPNTTTRDSVQDSAFEQGGPLSFVRGGADFGFVSQINSTYGLDMSFPSRTTRERQASIDCSAPENQRVYPEPSATIPQPRSHQIVEDIRESVSNHLSGESHPSSQNTLREPPPDTISTQNDPDSPLSSPNTETVAPTTFLPVPELSHARPSTGHTTSVIIPFSDVYPSASSSKTISNQPVGIIDAKFNSFGRIGRSTTSKGGSRREICEPYQKHLQGPMASTREMNPPPSESHRFADGKHKYERLTSFQITKLLKIYNVAPDQVPTVFYGLRRQPTPDRIYSCPMDGAQLTLAQFEAHCMESHSTLSCDPACPNRGDKTTKNHTNLCVWFVTCTVHHSEIVESAAVAMKHFINAHLLPDGLQCAHCDSVHGVVRTLFRHMLNGRRCNGMTEWRR